MNKDFIIESLDYLFPNAKCELNYNHDYELLIATMLSAQSTDKRVNEVTKILFSKYDIKSLYNADIKDIENIIRPVGTYHKKAKFIIEISKSLINDNNGKVPNNRDYLEKLPGIGRKTTNVVLANIYNIPSFAVDTHVRRVANILKLVNSNDVIVIENKLTKIFPNYLWNKLNNQLIFFGRYICTAKKPKCDNCPFNGYCKKSD